MDAVVGYPATGGTDGWHGFPWLTLVLGSGCLELPDDHTFTPEALAEGVRQVLATDLGSTDHQALDGLDPLSEMARWFTIEMVRDRTHPLSVSADQPGIENKNDADGHSPSPRPVETYAARLVLVASLLTRLYSYAWSTSGSPVSRWAEDQATFDDASASLQFGRLVDRMRAVVLEQIRATGQELATSLGADASREIAASVQSLLQCVAADLDTSPRRLRLTHVRLVTESSWYFLALRDGSVYPGWTELLLGLMLEEANSGQDQFTRTRPRYWDLQQVPKKVERLHSPATEHSWRALVAATEPVASPGSRDGGGTPTTMAVVPRGRLYAQAADVLWAQGRAARTGGRRRCPPASAFITSFDIELEMALWLQSNALDPEYWSDCPALHGPRAGHDGPSTQAPFYVILPVHVFRAQHAERATLCWLRGEVHPDRTLSPAAAFHRITHPRRWQLVTSNFDATLLLDGPHVVHLSGCPLFQLPNRENGPTFDVATMEQLAADLQRVGVSVDPEAINLQHAVTVDEYLAFRQSEAEHFWSAYQSPREGVLGGRGLPAFLSGSSPTRTGRGRNPRFWMALGVPVSDVTIRYRVVSQISSRRLLAAVSDVPTSNTTGRLRIGGRLGARDDRTGSEAAPVDTTSIGGAAGGGGDHARSPEPAKGEPEGREGGYDLDGVVVNRRINDDEASILYWLGFDVVTDDSRHFIEDLSHYAAHLRSHVPSRSSPTETCELTGEVVR